MSEPVLLQTKLLIPPLRPDVLVRERLKERFVLAEHIKLILVSAPAGFGKTTLVADWLKTKSVQAAWLSLDDADNNVMRFLRHLLSSIQAVTGLADEELELLKDAKTVQADEVLAPLLNKASALSTALCILLDDYHLITNQDVHDAIDFLLEYAPTQIKLCMIARSDPPLKLARLRAKAQLVELRSQDLRFTQEETLNFLRAHSGLELSNDDAHALSERAEGWAVGLQVIALSLSSVTNPTEFIQELATSNRFLLDYLLDEVLKHQSDKVQNFLLKTALLDRFNASLCEAILDPEDISTAPSQLIHELERANLFLISLGNGWYRYHHLFRDVLRHRLKTLHPHLLKPLQSHAAMWFKQNDFTQEALEQFLQAELFEDAAKLIIELGHTLIWKQGDAKTLARWLEKLPGELFATRADLRLLQAWACHVTGDIYQIEPLLDEADLLLECFDADISGLKTKELLQAESIALRSFVKRMQGDLAEAKSLSEQAIEQIPESNYQLRSLLNGNLGEVYYLKGNFQLAHDFHKEESRLAEKEGAVLPSRYALWRISDIQTQKGQLELAKRTSLMMLSLNKVKSIDALGFADIQLGIIALEQDQFEEADKHLSAGINLGKRLNNPRVFMPGYGPLVKLLLATKRIDEAQEVLEEAKALAETHGITWTWGIPLLDAWEGYFQLKSQKLDEALNWAEQTGLIAKKELNFADEFKALIIVRILLAKNMPKEALTLLEKVETSVAKTNCTRNKVEINVLKAISFETQEETENALSSLEQAVEVASKNGHCLSFTDEGEIMRLLLTKLKEQERQTAYTSKLLTVFPKAEGQTETSEQSLPEDIEALNERELSILRLIAGRLSNKEIARELDLSTNTVKWYAKSIFEKLNVHGRLKAGQKARELGLI